MKARLFNTLLGSALLLLLAGAVTWSLLLRSSPEKTVKDYLKAAARNDAQRAKALLSAETLKQMTEMESAMSQFMPMGGMGGGGGMATKMLPSGWGMKVRVGKAKVQGDKATVDIKVKAGQSAQGKAMPSVPWPPVRCVREGGKWRLDFTAELQMGKQMMAMFAQNAPRSTASRGTPPNAPSTARTAGAGQAAELVARGLEAKRAGRLEEAARHLREALRRDPVNVEAHWALAWVLADLGNKSGAVAEFEEVVRLGGDPNRVADAQAAIARLR